MGARSKNRGLIVALVLCLTMPVAGAQGFSLRVNDHRVSLDADGASLHAILKELQPYYPGIQIHSAENKTISWTCRDLPVDVFLEKLNVNFAAFFNAEGDPVAFWTMGREAGKAAVSPIDRELMEEILEHIENLQEDHIRWNASQSMWRLVDIGGDAIPLLEEALKSEDYQTSQFAAEVLYRLGTNYTPSVEFLGVMIEGMADDEYPSGKDMQGNYRYTHVNNARRGHSYFESADASVIDRAEPLLAKVLQSPDGQQRFLAAVILSTHRRQAYTEAVVRVLAPHLRDNRLSGDGLKAAHALFSMGAPVLPYVRNLLGSSDPQQAEFAREIIQDISAGQASHGYRSVYMGDWVPEAFPDIQGHY